MVTKLRLGLVWRCGSCVIKSRLYEDERGTQKGGHCTTRGWDEGKDLKVDVSFIVFTCSAKTQKSATW